jgi:hypothetical protein
MAPLARLRLLVVLVFSLGGGPGLAGPIRGGFGSAVLPTADDVSSPAVDLGFAVNFLGQTFTSVFVNQNGNLTFAAPLPDFTPVPLGQLKSAIVAPFFADVDTTVAGHISYGTGTVGGRAAFAATWDNVGYYGGTAGRTNSFQAVLVDRSDTGAGNFDLEYNYGGLNWESGDFNGGTNGRGGSSARAGYGGSGTAGTFYELPGSGVPGALLDDGPAGTALAANLLNSAEPGRYVFSGRDGQITGSLVSTPKAPVPPLPSGPIAPGGPIGVPEPGTWALAFCGLIAVGGRRAVRR